MPRTLNLWLAAGAASIPAAAALGRPLAWMVYRVSPSGSLQRAQLQTPPRGGLLGLTGPLPEDASADTLAQSLAGECRRRGFQGVVLACDSPANGLALALTARRIPCLTPVSPDGEAGPMVPSALSGGDFRAMLRDVAARHRGRLCLQITRMSHSFAMPAYPPEGEALTAAQLSALIAAHGVTPRFSPQMLCRYFTYQSASGPRFVLFDDAHTARLKIEAARDTGFTDAIVAYHEWGEGARAIWG